MTLIVLLALRGRGDIARRHADGSACAETVGARRPRSRPARRASATSARRSRAGWAAATRCCSRCRQRPTGPMSAPIQQISAEHERGVTLSRATQRWAGARADRRSSAAVHRGHAGLGSGWARSRSCSITSRSPSGPEPTWWPRPMSTLHRPVRRSGWWRRCRGRSRWRCWPKAAPQRTCSPPRRWDGSAPPARSCSSSRAWRGMRARGGEGAAMTGAALGAALPFGALADAARALGDLGAASLGVAGPAGPRLRERRAVQSRGDRRAGCSSRVLGRLRHTAPSRRAAA